MFVLPLPNREADLLWHSIMRVVSADDAKPAIALPEVTALLAGICEAQVRKCVERIAIPRHFFAEAAQNRATATWLENLLGTFGFAVESQGQYANLIATPREKFDEVILVGAHYDSVPGCPGADDNGSAVAAILGCAAACASWRKPLPVVFVAFNCEEDGLVGSRDFVSSFLYHAPFRVRCAHILEMVGFASSAPRSQQVPPGLPFRISDVGDFLGLLANGRSTRWLDNTLRQAATHTPDLPVTGLKVHLGLEKYLPVLGRSDHAPFWESRIPAVMWTDTSEFRNRNYHRETDTPDTLDYTFLRKVTQLLTATVIAQAA